MFDFHRYKRVPGGSSGEVGGHKASTYQLNKKQTGSKEEDFLVLWRNHRDGSVVSGN